MMDLNDVVDVKDIKNQDYLFEGAMVHLHPTAPVFEGITFMTRHNGRWQMFTCKERRSVGMFSDDYAILADNTSYSFPMCVCKRIIEVH